MTRVSEAVSQREQQLFVGRQRELAAFERWLVAGTAFPEILSISGPGGVGKTTLLHAFRRIAVELGRPVFLADGRDFPATPQALLVALADPGGAELEQVVARLNDAAPLLMLDTFEALSVLSGYLQDEILPRLDTNVKVVIAGRHAPGLAWNRGDAWLKIIRPLPLEGFSSQETQEYLLRRGINEPELAIKVARAAGGNPLALSLAADMVVNFHVRDFTVAPEWRLVVRSLAEQLLHDIKDPELRELLEACAVVHQFDEPTLAAISGRDHVSTAFAQLCRLSIVKPSEHGLQLHDDVRQHLAADLNWRQPQRYNLLRARTLAYYRERLRSAPSHEREWLVVECFFLWSNAVIQQVFFSPAEPGQVRAEARRPADDASIRRLYAARIETTYADELGGGPIPRPEGDQEFLDAILRYPGSRIRVARDELGRFMGFSTVVPICQESLQVLQLNPGITALVRAHWSATELATLPATAESARCFSLCHVVHTREQAGPVRAALVRDFSGLFAMGGTYLCSTLLPSYKGLLEACGFERIPAAQIDAWGTGYLVDGYVLDLSRVGFERWIEAMVNGRPLARPLDSAVVERELQTALQHWEDSEWLVRSPLPRMLQAPEGLEGDGPAAFRDVIRRTLAEQRAGALPDLELAYRAIEHAYLSNGASRKRVARDLAVSRATFYRLVKRGIHGLAEALSQQRN